MNQDRQVPPTAKTTQPKWALTVMTVSEPTCLKCGGGEVTLRGNQLVEVAERWTEGNLLYTDELAPPQGEWVGPVRGTCDGCGHRWTVLPGHPMHLPEMPKQAYLVVYLDGGVVTGHEVAAGADLARQKCLTHVGRAMTVDESTLDSDGAFGVGDGVDLDAWAFPIPAIAPADGGRPVGEDQISLECRFRAPDSGLCGWTGPASDAGWNARSGEWVCPGCGTTEGLRVTD